MVPGRGRGQLIKGLDVMQGNAFKWHEVGCVVTRPGDAGVSRGGFRGREGGRSCVAESGGHMDEGEVGLR